MAKKEELPTENAADNTAPLEKTEAPAVEVSEDMAEQAPKSKKQLWMEKMRGVNPDLADDDEEGFYNSLDQYDTDTNSKLSKLSESDSKLREMIMNDPDMAGFFNSVASGMPSAVAARLHWGEAMMQEGDDEEITARYAEASKLRAESVAKSKEIEAKQKANMEKSIVNINKMIADKEMTDEEGAAFFEKVIDMVDDIYMCNYTPELLERVYKALNYDTDVKDALDMGMTEGKNEKIRATTKKVVGDGMPIPQPIAMQQGKKADPLQRNRPSFFDPKFKGTQV